jgi:hypothetical protein
MCAAYFIERTGPAKMVEKHIADSTTAALPNENPSWKSTIKRLVLYFSLQKNLSWIYDTTKPSKSIPIMFGLK